MRTRIAAVVFSFGLLAAGTGLGEDAKPWKVVPKGTAVEFKGKKNMNYRWSLLRDDGIEVREQDFVKGRNEKKLCLHRELKGLVFSWDQKEPDENKNKVAKYVIFFCGEDVNVNSGPVSGQEKKFFDQQFANQMFAIEIEATDKAPKQIVDKNSPTKWGRIYAFAVYSNDEWVSTPVRAKEGTWKGPKEGDWDKDAIVLPDKYEWPK
ncbi:MAG TPA: hypothetical protein VFF73_07070 [Planctomycetota bacterium]|nr:hypothetical protein [Planctomycetota bacterium]